MAKSKKKLLASFHDPSPDPPPRRYAPAMPEPDIGVDSRWAPRCQLLWHHYSRDALLVWLADSANIPRALDLLRAPPYQPLAFHFWWAPPPTPAMAVRTADVLRVWEQEGLLTLSITGQHEKGYRVVSATADGLRAEDLDEEARRARLTPARFFPSPADEA